MLSARAVAGVAGALLGLAVLTAAPARAGGDWNDKQIRWQSYQDGLAAAKKEKKPICLIFYTEWCPHCANYSAVFHDPKVVDMTLLLRRAHAGLGAGGHGGGEQETAVGSRRLDTGIWPVKPGRELVRCHHAATAGTR